MENVNLVLDYLSDARGIYGIVARGEDLTAHLIVRPDRAAKLAEYGGKFTTKDRRQHYFVPTFFHALPRTSLRWKKYTGEGALISVAISVFKNPKCADTEDEIADLFSCSPPESEATNLRHFFVAQARAGAILNKLLGEVLQTVPADKLKIIRRFPHSVRPRLFSSLYAAGNRAWQLAESFPALCVRIYGFNRDGDEEQQVKRADALVRRGARMRDVAAAVGVPMSFRHFPPAVSTKVFSTAGKFLARHPDLIDNFCPATVPRIRAWIDAITAASGIEDNEFSQWVARNAMAVGHYREVADRIKDISDWVRASWANKLIDMIDPQQARALGRLLALKQPPHIDPLGNIEAAIIPDPLVSRWFNPNMAGQTVMRLSDDWHREVSKIAAEKFTFPSPWYPGADIGDHTIKPIADHVELSAMARRFRNCAATYARDIAAGRRYLYVISNGKPLVMAEVFYCVSDKKPTLGQMRGPYNAAPNAGAASAFKKWFRQMRKTHGDGNRSELATRLPGDVYDDRIPF